jgi:16S rRNA (cytosine1402-N4)-methyltransferase
LPTSGSKEQGEPRVVIDGTLGGAGHALHFLPGLRSCDTLVGVDRDESAIARATQVLTQHIALNPNVCHVRLIHSSYRELPKLMEENSIPLADCILLDLGLSSDQLEDRTRGFSFRAGGDLDMRFCKEEGISVADLLAKIDERELADIIYQYGEERFSRRIARAIVERRRIAPVRTAEELVDLVHRSVPGKIHGRVDSATRTFQALRIAVNHELDHLRKALADLPNCLKPGGRLVVISFHSLEDRMVKHALREDLRMEVLTRKPIMASDEEVSNNPRSRSAKLRVARKL